MSGEQVPLERLLENPRLWRGSRYAEGRRSGIATGYQVLDKHLPDGGWPRESLTEILLDDHGIGELQLLMPAIAQLSQEEREHAEPGWIAWIAPPFQPYGPALKKCGVDLSRILIVRPRDNSEVLWATEQALSSGTCAAVLFWPERLDDQASRRLQLAAEKGRSWAVAFRSLTARKQNSAAALRIELTPGTQSTRLHILKSRGGRPAVIHNIFPA